MTITWDGIEFNGPYQIHSWTKTNVAGVYAIMARENSPEGSAGFSLLYVGQTADFGKGDFPDHHEKYLCWLRNCGGEEGNMYISMHDERYEAKRFLLESQLIKRYHPICNRA